MVQSQTDNICSSNALSDLTTCLTKLCVNPVDTQSLVAGLGVSISPKLEYSCKMSMVPAASDDGATLALNGSCSTSPYPFKSFFPQGVGSIAASNGCKIEIYSEEDCLGSAGSVDIGTSQNSQCIFRGGRSARLACNNELDGECLSYLFGLDLRLNPPFQPPVPTSTRPAAHHPPTPTPLSLATVLPLPPHLVPCLQALAV